MRLHESQRDRSRLPPTLIPSARSQFRLFRAICCGQISARIGHHDAAAKASCMRLLEVFRLPRPQFIPRAVLARNFFDTEDSFSPPVPLISNAPSRSFRATKRLYSYLCFLPSSSSIYLSFPCPFSMIHLWLRCSLFLIVVIVIGLGSFFVLNL